MNEKRTFEETGVTFVVEWKDDTYFHPSDVDWLGELSDRFEPGAIRRKYQKSSWRSALEYKWFIPDNSIKIQRAYFSSMGMSKHEAYTKARDNAIADYDRLINYGDEWYMMYVTVTAFIGGREIASDSLHGIESDSSEEYLKEIEIDVILDCKVQVIEELESVVEMVTVLGNFIQKESVNE